MGNLTPIEEAVLEELTTDEERKAQDISRIVQWMKIKFSKSKMKTGKINPCKPFDCTISLEPPFGFGYDLGFKNPVWLHNRLSHRIFVPVC